MKTVEKETPTNDTMLTLDESAKKCRVHRNTVRNWEKYGLKPVRIGPRLIRYFASDLERFISR